MTQLDLKDGITLMSGALFSYQDPAACEVTIEDIAQPLSNICRFAGQLPYFYSVAQHSVNASYIVAPEFAYTALLHDTAECFTGDIVTPLKVAVPQFKELELKIEAVMAERFGFQFPLPPEVKLADLQMLGLEMEFIRGQDCSQHSVLNGIDYRSMEFMPGVELKTWSPRQACANFIRRYEELRL